MNDLKAIPIPALRRLPRYLSYLQSLQEQGKKSVSASSMSEILGVQHTLVRKDLSMTGVEGQPKLGHKVDELIVAIEKFLNWNNPTEAFLIGVGHLGTALINYTGFKNTGITIVAGFDTDSHRIGTRIGSIEVLHLSKLAGLIQRMKIQIGIIAAPKDHAQEIADLLVSNGIKAIWNFAPITLRVPSSVIVEDVDIYASLAVLSKRLQADDSSDLSLIP